MLQLFSHQYPCTCAHLSPYISRCSHLQILLHVFKWAQTLILNAGFQNCVHIPTCPCAFADDATHLHIVLLQQWADKWGSVKELKGFFLSLMFEFSFPHNLYSVLEIVILLHYTWVELLAVPVQLVLCLTHIVNFHFFWNIKVTKNIQAKE